MDGPAQCLHCVSEDDWDAIQRLGPVALRDSALDALKIEVETLSKSLKERGWRWMNVGNPTNSRSLTDSRENPISTFQKYLQQNDLERSKKSGCITCSLLLDGIRVMCPGEDILKTFILRILKGPERTSYNDDWNMVITVSRIGKQSRQIEFFTTTSMWTIPL